MRHYKQYGMRKINFLLLKMKLFLSYFEISSFFGDLWA